MPFDKLLYILILVFSFANIHIASAKTEVKAKPAISENAKGEVSSQNPYLVTNIFAFGKEKDSKISREKAIATANRSALSLLLNNLGVNIESQKILSDEAIDNLIYSRQIMDEKIAGNYYSAKFNIEFSKSAIKSSFNVVADSSSNVPSNSTKDLYIIFPVDLSGIQPLLWEKTNLWRQDIENYISSNNVKTLLIPASDDITINDINLENEKDYDFAHFTSVIYRYNAKGAIIAYYQLDDIENKANITLKTIEFPEIKKIRLSFINSENFNEVGLMNEAAQRSMNYLTQSSKKPEIKVKEASNSEININIQITDLEDWLTIEDRIRDMPFVRNLKLQSISRNIAKITLITNGEDQNIAKLFSQYHFLLKRDSGEYFLSVMK